jgi:hypothetical protein
MRSSCGCGRAFASAVLAVGLALAAVPVASADPEVLPDPPIPGVEDPPPAVLGVEDPAPVGDADAAQTACGQFAIALDYSASNYTDFANGLALGNQYADPEVAEANTVGRTALRQSAVTAMDAANTPGLAPEIASPMHAWSVDATKLLLMMAVRANVDAINNVATEMNDDTSAVQLACSQAGSRA